MFETTSMFRYGGFSFGHVLEHIPIEFDSEGPEEFRKFAIRRISKVILCREEKEYQEIFKQIDIFI